VALVGFAFGFTVESAGMESSDNFSAAKFHFRLGTKCA
jgi:hypothetical protein